MEQRKGILPVAVSQIPFAERFYARLFPAQCQTIQLFDALQDAGKEFEFGRPFINGPFDYHCLQLCIRLRNYKVAFVWQDRLPTIFGVDADFLALQLLLIFP